MSVPQTNLPLGAARMDDDDGPPLQVIWVAGAGATFLEGAAGEALSRLRGRGVEVLCGCAPEGSEGLEGRGAERLRLPLGGPVLDPVSFGVAWLLLTAACIERRAAILHSLDPRTHLLVGLAGKAAGVPVRLASVGGDGHVWGSERLGGWQDRLLAGLLTAAFVSEAGQRELRRAGLAPLELRVVPSAARLLEEYGHLLEGVGV